MECDPEVRELVVHVAVPVLLMVATAEQVMALLPSLKVTTFVVSKGTMVEGTGVTCGVTLAVSVIGWPAVGLDEAETVVVVLTALTWKLPDVAEADL